MVLMDKVSLRGIDVYAHHGVHPAERELGQRFVIDVDLWVDCAIAARTDSLTAALDYTEVHRRICAVTAENSFHLIEALAGRLCRALLEGFPVDRVRVRVKKPNPPIPSFLGTAAVTFERDQAWLEDERGRQK